MLEGSDHKVCCHCYVNVYPYNLIMFRQASGVYKDNNENCLEIFYGLKFPNDGLTISFLH